MSWWRLWLTAVLVVGGRRDQAGAVGSSVGWRNSLGIFSVRFSENTWQNADEVGQGPQAKACRVPALLGTVGQMQPPWEAGEQTSLSFCWWVGMPRKSFLLASLWLEVWRCNRWKMVSCSPCESCPWFLGHPCCSTALRLPLSPELSLAQAACPLPTDPPGSPNFLSILMICCKCALFCSQNPFSAVITSVLPNNWNKGLFRLLSLQNNNC